MLRSLCLAVSRGEGGIDRVFVNDPSPAFTAWAETYASLDLSGPLSGKRMVLVDGKCEHKTGAYFPAAWPPDRAEAAA